MRTPDENDFPADDRQADGNEDQQSQQDIHSNGFDQDDEPGTGNDDAEIDRLEQAYESAEPSYTLEDEDDAE